MKQLLIRVGILHRVIVVHIWIHFCSNVSWSF